MEHRSFHYTPQNLNSGQQANEAEKKRSTWHSSQALASVKQPSYENTHGLPLKEFVNVEEVQEPISTFNQLNHQSTANRISRQSTPSGSNFGLGRDDAKYKSSHASMVGDSMELPTSKNDLLENASSCKIPIQSMRESTIARSGRQIRTYDQMDSSPYRSTHHSRIHPTTRQSMATQSVRQSETINDQMDSPYISSHQSKPTRFVQKSITNEPFVDASNTEIQQLQAEAWEDHNTSMQPPYASTRQLMVNQSGRQSKANQFGRQSTTNQSTHQSLASKSNRQSIIQNQDFNAIEFERTNQPYDLRSNHQSVIENLLYDDDGNILQNDSLYRVVQQSMANPLIQQSIVEHPTQQPSNNPSARQSMGNDYLRQSMVGRSTQQSKNQSIHDDTQVFDTTPIIPQQLHQSMVNPLARQSMVDHSTLQSMPNQYVHSSSSSPITQQSTLYRSNQPSMIMDEDTSINHHEIWPQDVRKQQSLYGSTRQSMTNRSTRQSMANRSARQSGTNKSSRPSTILGYNMDNQIWNDINQSYVMPCKSTRQSIPTRFVRPSTTDGQISYARTLESETEIPSFKPTRQSMASKSTHQSKSVSPSSDAEILESDDALLISGPYTSNGQSMANKSTRQSMTNPSIRQSMATRSHRQSMSNKSSRQSIADQSFKQSIAPRLPHQSIVEEHDPTRLLLYSKESLSSVPRYQSNQSSMANRSTRQSALNKDVRQLKAGNSEYETSDFENEFISNQSPSKSTRHSIINQSARQSEGNKSARQSTTFRPIQPYALDHQNADIQMFDNEISQSQQSIANQSIRQSNVEGSNTKVLDDEIFPSQMSMEERLAQQSYRNRSVRPSMVSKSTHELTTEDSNINLQMLENETESIPQSKANQSTRQSQGSRSTCQSIGMRSMRASTADQEIGNIQMFENEVPQIHQSTINRSIQQPMANRFNQQSTTTNAEVHMLNNEMYISPISFGERLARISQRNSSTRQSIGLRSAHESAIDNPNLELHIRNDEPQSIQQSIANRSARQSQGNGLVQQLQGNKLAQESTNDGSIHQSTIDDQNLELQILNDDIQLSPSPYVSSRQSMMNRSARKSSIDRLPQESNDNKSMQISTTQGFTLEPDFLDDGNKMRAGPLRSVPQSIENTSSHHSIAEGPSYHGEMLESKVHTTEPSYRSIHQSIGEAQAPRRLSSDEHFQNQLNEGKFSTLASYSEDQFEFQNSNVEPRLNLEPSQSMPSPSRFVTLEVRSNVQKESLDKFLVGGWDSVTLKIPPEMHSLLHGIRNSLSSDNLDLDLEQHMANMAEGNDGQCSANIRILYSGIYNSNQEPTSSDLCEQSQISHTHSGSDSSNCPSCNVEKEQGTVRFNIEGS